MTRRSSPVVHDLFAGAGLFSYAFVQEGFQVAFAVELNQLAAETYRKNVGDHIAIADVNRTEPQGKCDVLIAGPPCQGFSTLGKRNPHDPRNGLSLEVARWAESTKPSVIVIENVAAFLDAPVWLELKISLEHLGYDVSATILDAWEFGVPQRRNRSFTFATKGRAVIPERADERQTVRNAFDCLPRESNGDGMHVPVTPTEAALERIRAIPYGGDRRDIMRVRPDLVPPSWLKMGVEVTDVWGRLSWDEPSNTLRTDLHPSKGRYIHPEKDRVITTREAARLHSIPDSWSFAGARYPQVRQLGNSVPPKLGRAIARAVYAALS